MFRGTCSSIEMLKGYIERESLGNPVLEGTLLGTTGISHIFQYNLKLEIPSQILFYKVLSVTQLVINEIVAQHSEFKLFGAASCRLKHIGQKISFIFYMFRMKSGFYSNLLMCA